MWRWNTIQRIQSNTWWIKKISGVALHCSQLYKTPIFSYNPNTFQVERVLETI